MFEGGEEILVDRVGFAVDCQLFGLIGAEAAGPSAGRSAGQKLTSSKPHIELDFDALGRPGAASKAGETGASGPAAPKIPAM